MNEDLPREARRLIGEEDASDEMTRKRYRLISLDFADTLVQAWPDWATHYLRAYREAGISVDLEQLRAAADAAWTEDRLRLPLVFPADERHDAERQRVVEGRILARLGIHDETLTDHLLQRMRQIFRDPACFRLFPEVPDTLEALRARGYQLGIVSNWNWYLPELCRALGLDRYVDFIVASARVGAEKPHPAIFRAALAQAQTAPEQALHVGDNPKADVLGAHRAGITGVLIDRRRHGESPGGLVIRSLAELLDWL